ncbi:MAG: DUF4339 domain-containing protein [Chitinophagaceae bacterium]
MSTYYLFENGKQKGPFSFEDLKKRLITSSTAVWREGMTEWSEAGKMEELASILVKTPPAYPPDIKQEQPPHPYLSILSESSEKDKRPGKYVAWIAIGAAAIIIIAYLNIDSAGTVENAATAVTAPQEIKSPAAFSISKQPSPEEQRTELLQKEKQNPKLYISNNSDWRKKLIGGTVLEGTLINRAKLTGFKDIVLEVQWLSKTNEVIETKPFTVHDFAGAGKTIKYKLKCSGPSRFGNVRASVVTATPVD